MKPSHCRSFLLASAAFLAACGGGVTEPHGPEPQPVFSRLEVAPRDTSLILTPSGGTLQISFVPMDALGRTVPLSGVPVFESSRPEVAQVSHTGIVTALAPGEALIRTSLTIGDRTRVGETKIRVVPPGIPLGPLVGVYEFTAVVTAFDAAWGNFDGARYTAVLDIQEGKGRYRDLTLREADGTGVYRFDLDGDLLYFPGAMGVTGFGFWESGGINGDRWVLTTSITEHGPDRIAGTWNRHHFSGHWEARRIAP